MTIPLTASKLRMIGEPGVLYEQSGLSPACASIQALLLASDCTRLTFGGIFETLRMRKSAVSNALSYLTSTGRIAYLTYPGNRKSYIRFKVQSLHSAVENHLASLNTFHSLMKRIVQERPGEPAAFNHSLIEMINLPDFMEKERPQLIDKWKARNN